MNKDGYRYKLLVKLTKCGDFWRMDASDYPKFINYIKHYFCECECISKAMSDNILYADLSEDDLMVIGAYYGIYSPDVDTLLLAEVYLDYINLPREPLFTIRLCIKNDFEKLYFISTKMILNRKSVF
ncbi:MAG: hypothetical protein H6Q12_1103 [Bacteroidetes bacterium]|nr:hypothetical protein [Bacteroidota bacterium]